MSTLKTDWHRSAPLTATSAKAQTELFPYLIKLVRGEDLSAAEAEAFFGQMTSGANGSIQVAAALAALTAKGETGEELAGMAEAMRSLAVKVRAPRNSIDIGGTGSSNAKTFNVSTAAAIVAAGAGLTVAKQSNKAVMSGTGSADVLAELGVRTAVDPTAAQSSLNTGMCFMFAPKFYPELRRLADVRGRLGIRTCLNILGLLASPASVSRQLLGVWHRSLVLPAAQALALLKRESAWVVHGEDGLDELTIAGKSHIATVQDGKIQAYVIAPKDFGLKAAPIDNIKASTPKESAAIISEILSSRRRDEARSLVVINAAAALIAGGVAKDPMQAARLAEQSIDSGQAQNKLERLIQITNKKAA